MNIDEKNPQQNIERQNSTIIRKIIHPNQEFLGCKGGLIYTNQLTWYNT